MRQIPCDLTIQVRNRTLPEVPLLIISLLPPGRKHCLDFCDHYYLAFLQDTEFLRWCFFSGLVPHTLEPPVFPPMIMVHRPKGQILSLEIFSRRISLRGVWQGSALQCVQNQRITPHKILTLGMECLGINGSWIFATVSSQYLTNQL